MPSSTANVYFLGNDRVLDITIAFLNSFRLYNPDAALCLIPFNSKFERLAQLQDEYGFSIFDRPAVLAECDRISSAFHGEPAGQYRKLAMWEGDFDEFVYIDVDTVVLQNVKFALQFLSEYDFVTSHSNIPGIRKWVWKESIHESGALTREQISYAANTGFIVSRKGALTLGFAARQLQNGVGLSSHMELLCAEQPFLNYLIVTSGRPYTSLLQIARESGRIDLPMERWAGNRRELIRDGKIVFPTHPHVFLFHWAGEWHREQHLNNPLWRYHRNLRTHLCQ